MSKYRIDVFTASGMMFQLLQEFVHLDEANVEATKIMTNGLRICVTPECLTYIPVHLITSVSVSHPDKVFGITAAVLDLSAEAAISDEA